MTWFYFAIGAIFCFTSHSLLQRILAVKCVNTRAMAVAFNLIAAFLALIIFVFSGDYINFSIPNNWGAWLTLIIACLMYGLFERGRFQVAKQLDASVFSVIANISLLVAFIGSLFLYGEVLTVNKILGVLLIMIALFLVSYVNKTTKIIFSLSGVMMGILISSFLGLGWMLDKKGSLYFNASTYSFLVWTVPIIIIYFPYVELRDIIREFKINSWKIFVMAGLNVSGYLLQLKALSIYEATIVLPFIQIYSLFTVLLGIILLKEKENIPRKVLAGILALVGVYFLT